MRPANAVSAALVAGLVGATPGGVGVARGEVPAAAQDQASPALDYGPHAVGFTVIEALDSTRAFRPLRDFSGRRAAETARPVQISIWYPAEATAGATSMRAGEFRLLREREVDFDLALGEADEARLRTRFIDEAASFGQDRPAAARTWDEPTPAVWGASPLPGPHPAVLYFTAAGVSNPLLAAYLASHGLVVASFPSNGRMTEGSLEFTPNALTLDTDMDDAGFVHALLRRLPYVDTDRLAVAAFSSGSLAALLWTMRDMQPAAIVTIEGWERYRRGADIVGGSVHYDPNRVRVPFLMLERGADEASPQYAKVPDVVGALPYADITRVAFRDAAHADFLSHVSFGHTPSHAETYEASARMIRAFLEENIREAGRRTGAVPSVAFQDALEPPTDSLFTVEDRPGIGPVPTEEELYRLAETDPVAAAAAYRDASRVVPGSSLFREHVLRRAALFAGSPADSATIMEIVRDAYPEAGPGAPPPPLAGAEAAFLAVAVSDLAAASAWYADLLGLELVRDVSSADGVLRGQVLFVRDIDALFAHLRARGVEADERIETDSHTGLRFFVFHDLEGNGIQVFGR